MQTLKLDTLQREEDRIYEKVFKHNKFNVYSKVLSSNNRRSSTRAGRYRRIDSNQDPPDSLIRVSIFYVKNSDLESNIARNL